mmetsp:Transcript_37288/g.57197  ORF Transcript_37288/g.57197 Transcript_37288/m.57197 type:complete len:81 (+) Transcript_37288:353-595(+)
MPEGNGIMTDAEYKWTMGLPANYQGKISLNSTYGHLPSSNPWANIYFQVPQKYHHYEPLQGPPPQSSSSSAVGLANKATQ